MRTGSPCMFQPVATTCRCRRQSKLEARDRQAALRAVLLLVADRVDVGVDQVADLAVDEPGEHPQADADLRRGQPRAPASNIVSVRSADQLPQLGVEVDDRGGGGAQHGVAEQPDRGDAHPRS